MASSPSSGQPNTELTLDQIHTSALEMREKINAIRVDYFRAAIQTEAGLLHAKNESEPPIEQRSFSLAYPKRRMFAKSTEGSNLPSDRQFTVDKENCEFHDDGQLSEAEKEENREFVVQVEPYSIYCDILFSDEKHAHPPQDIWIFPFVLKGTGGPYVVHEKQELVNGVMCHVLEWLNHDIIWVDSQNPAVMVRRERSFEYEDGKVVTETYDFLELEDLGDGITLPKKVITSYFGALRHSPKPRNCIESVDVLEVSLIKVNDDVTEEDFEVVTVEL